MKRTGSFCLLVCAATVLHAQNDGDHAITDGLGRTHLATDAIQTSAPVNFTVGTAPNLNATLNVRGDQLPVNDLLGIGLCTFRTDVQSATAQVWRMMRDVNDIGVLWHANNHVSFHVQSGVPRNDVQDRYSGLLLQNHVGDGMWVMNDGTSLQKS